MNLYLNIEILNKISFKVITWHGKRLERYECIFG